MDAIEEDKTRSNDEKERPQEPPLPSAVVREEPESQKHDETKQANGQSAQADNANKKPHISLWGRIKLAWKNTTIANKLIAVFTGITALATVASAILYWRQVGVMGEQLSVMSGQLEQMKTDSESSSSTSDRQLSIMEGQLKQAQEAFHLEQRAWVSCRNGQCTPIVAGNGNKISFELLFANSGTTPANKVKVGCEVLIERKNYDIESYALPRREVAKTEITTERTIAPNITQRAPHNTDVEELTEDMVTRIKNGERVVYILGEVVYDDIFDQRHMTMYCCVIHPATWQLVAYKQYNRME